MKEETNYQKLVIADVLFSVVHIINIIIPGDSQDLSVIPLVIWDLLLCLIYMIVHGIVTYCVYRRIFYPHFITGIIILSSTLFLSLFPYVDKLWIIGSSVYFVGFFAISVIGSLITMFVCKLYALKQRSVKNARKTDSDY